MKIKGTVKKLYYQMIMLPSSFGTPVSTKNWEAEYKGDKWEHISLIDEMARYMVIVGYIRFVGERLENPSPSLLDIGCGNGVLLKYLRPSDYDSYLGIDIAETAIEKAQCYSNPKTKFIVGDFDQRLDEGLFDIIVFNESLYYARNPHATLLCYSSILNKNGFLVVSMFGYRNHSVIEKVIQKDFEVVDSVEVKNLKKNVWRIVLLHPR